MKFKFFY